MKKTRHPSPRKAAWARFRKNRAALLSLWLVGLLLLIALLKDLLATDLPLYARFHGQSFYPAFAAITEVAATDSFQDPATGKWERLQYDIVNWKQLNFEAVWWAPIPWSPHRPDRLNSNYVGPAEQQHILSQEGKLAEMPLRFRHFLGTNAIGQDVAAGIVHGAAVSLQVGLLAAAIGTFIGILLGAFAGFSGNDRLQMGTADFWAALVGICLGFFYGFSVRRFIISDAFAKGIVPGMFQLFAGIVIASVFVLILILISKLIFKNKKSKIPVPVDTVVMKIIEILNSLPRLLLILTIAAIAGRSIAMIILVIGFTMWTGIARITRAEMLRLRHLGFIEASHALGFQQRRIIWVHALPNALGPVFVSVAFAVAAAILLESALSFLGIGLPAETVSWGSLLSAGRQQFQAWWLVIFPGLAVFFTVTAFNLIGEGLRDAIDPK
ncbi:MAG: ABC transporter permease [Bacteroidia bacterium]